MHHTTRSQTKIRLEVGNLAIHIITHESFQTSNVCIYNLQSDKVALEIHTIWCILSITVSDSCLKET